MNREQLLAKKAAGEALTPEEETFLSSSEPAPNSEETPPTPTPPAPATDKQDRYITVLEETLREQNRQIQELMSRGATPPAAAPKIDPEQEKQEFYNDPAGMTRKIINEALADSIKPLQEFVKGLKVDGSPYVSMLNKFKGDARFAEALSDAQVLLAVEKIMEKTELNDVNMQSAIVHAIGLRSIGALGTVAPAPARPAAPAPTPTPSTVLPPHVRPSAAPTPAPTGGNNGKPARPPMTENQRRLMREQGFKTEEEYWQWMELPAADVAQADIGKARA